jgi:hypothetical protein
MKIPGPVQNKKPSFDFEYEFVSLKSDPKNFKKFLFEGMIKVKRGGQFETNKKIFPKILSFYNLLKIDAEFIYATLTYESGHKNLEADTSADPSDAPAGGKYNDRRDRMSPSQVKVV